MVKENFDLDYLTLSQAALYLGISKSKMQKMSAGRALPVYKPTANGKVFFLKEDLEKYMAAGRCSSIYELQELVSITRMSNKILKT